MSRTASYIITKAYLAAQRKSTPPAAGTTKYNALLAIVDSMQQLWSSEPDIEWSSLYSLVTIGTVSATDTFDLDDSISSISKREGDFVLLTNGTNTTTVKLVAPNQLYENRYVYACAQIGQTLKFSKAFLSTDSVFGYNINVPSILFPDDIVIGTNTVQVDDPMWLAYMTAADFIKSDTQKSVLYDKLISLADQHMQKMKNDNGGQYEAVVMNWRPEGAQD